MKAEAIHLDDDVIALLEGGGLPTSDISTGRRIRLFGFREDGRLVGVVGVEDYGTDGMLRSLAVAQDRRNCGYGISLVSCAESDAVSRGIRRLYLLTTSASAFFARLGYEAIPRSKAPGAIAATPQFASLCPASSMFMCKVLG